ncbi:MAG TPA: hypothetical protein VIG97_11765 [Luteimonas sp.]
MKTGLIWAVAGAALLIGCGAAKLPEAEAATADPGPGMLDVLGDKPGPIEIAPGITPLPADYEPVVAMPDDYAPSTEEDYANAAASMAAIEAAADAAADVVASEPRVRLRLQERMGPAYSVITYLVVQSTDDRVAITSVDANRGNCALLTAAGAAPKYPVTLGFGGELWLQPVMCGELLEAKVHTSAGAFDFTIAAY